MRIVSESECQSWLADRWREPFAWPAVQDRYTYSTAYVVPADAGRKTALARELNAQIDHRGQGLLWIHEWGVFPSSENMSLFQGYRRFLGDERSLFEAPGHLFNGADLSAVECLLDLVLYFFWGASVFDSRDTWLRVSHDEILSVHTTVPAVLTRWQESLAEFELKAISRTVTRPER